MYMYSVTKVNLLGNYHSLFVKLKFTQHFFILAMLTTCINRHVLLNLNNIGQKNTALYLILCR